MNEEIYDLELTKLTLEINRSEAKHILVQLPDGLKPCADKILSFIKENHPGVFITFWAGSCFGACDVPLHVKDFDLVVQFGHSPWRF